MRTSFADREPCVPCQGYPAAFQGLLSVDNIKNAFP